MPEYSTARRVWRVIYPPLIYLGLSLVVSFVGGIIFSIQFIVSAGGSMPDLAEISTTLTQHLLEKAMLLQLISSAIGVAIFIPMWNKTRKQIPRFTGTGMTAPKIALTVFAGLGGSLFIGAVITLLDLTKHFPSYEVIETFLNGGNIWVQILAVVIMAPIVEELVFRGVVLNRLLYRLPVWAAVLISGAMFGISHLNLLQGLYAFIFGVALSLLYVRSRNIWLTIIGHTAFNAAGYLVNGICAAMGVEEISELALLAVSAVVFAVSAWLFTKQPVPSAVLPFPSAPEPEEPLGEM